MSHVTAEARVIKSDASIHYHERTDCPTIFTDPGVRTVAEAFAIRIGLTPCPTCLPPEVEEAWQQTKYIL